MKSDLAVTYTLPMMHHLALLYLLAAQDSHYAFAPPAPGITVASDVEYGKSGETRLAMDVFKPAGAPSGRAPALVFFNRATGAERSQGFYGAWARAAASKGLIAILPDLRSGSEAADFRVLVAYLEAHGREQGIDGVAVYAGLGQRLQRVPGRRGSVS